MFSRKKKNYAWVYVCGILAILIIAVFILIGAFTDRNDKDALQASLESKANQSEDSSSDSESIRTPQTQDNSKGETEDGAEENKNDQNQFYQSYYLVKYDNHVIKIFFSDETGNLTELEETTIVYETLSEEDQRRFREGIQVSGRDDLNRLIMDYES